MYKELIAKVKWCYSKDLLRGTGERYLVPADDELENLFHKGYSFCIIDKTEKNGTGWLIMSDSILIIQRLYKEASYLSTLADSRYLVAKMEYSKAYAEFDESAKALNSNWAYE